MTRVIAICNFICAFGYSFEWLSTYAESARCSSCQCCFGTTPSNVASGNHYFCKSTVALSQIKIGIISNIASLDALLNVRVVKIAMGI